MIYSMYFLQILKTKYQVDIQIEKGLLTISNEKKELVKEKDYKIIRNEFIYKNFKRSFSIDENINTESIQARYENGVLKLFLQKKSKIKNSLKQISIN